MGMGDTTGMGSGALFWGEASRSSGMAGGLDEPAIGKLSWPPAIGASSLEPLEVALLVAVVADFVLRVAWDMRLDMPNTKCA